MHLGVPSYNVEYGARPGRAGPRRGGPRLRVLLGGRAHPGWTTCPPPSPIPSEGAGRGGRPDDLSVSIFAFKPPTPDAVKRLADMGVVRVTMVAPRRLDDALPFLDRTATLAG